MSSDNKDWVTRVEELSKRILDRDMLEETERSVIELAVDMRKKQIKEEESKSTSSIWEVKNEFAAAQKAFHLAIDRLIKDRENNGNT